MIPVYLFQAHRVLATRTLSAWLSRANGANLITNFDNRLATVSGPVTANFKYDGDTGFAGAGSKRIRATINGGLDTVFIGNYFEWNVATQTKRTYYYAGATRIAMREGSTDPQWILGDHLSSTSKMVSYLGADTGSQSYKAWGETRLQTGTIPTKYQYTGQYNQVIIGLYYYGARWYDANLGRWIQPDNFIPESTQGIQAWDRFAYINNNPLTYVDPSGHCIWDLCIVEGGIGLIEIVLLVSATVLVSEFVANGGPEVFGETVTECTETIVEWATEEVGNQVEKLKDLYDNLELQGENVAFSKGDGGAKSSAQHLAMLLGHDVAGFGSHPGMPDPEGRDRKTNAVGFRNDLRNILDNMREGENLQQYLERQGWTSDQISSYTKTIENYMENILPTDVEYYGVTEDLQQELWYLLEQLGVS